MKKTFWTFRIKFKSDGKCIERTENGTYKQVLRTLLGIYGDTFEVVFAI